MRGFSVFNFYPTRVAGDNTTDSGAYKTRSKPVFNPFRTAVSFPGQLGTGYLEFECRVPKTGLEF